MTEIPSPETAGVSLLVVNYGGPELVRSLIRSLEAHHDARFVREIVLVDNGYPERGDLRELSPPLTASIPLVFLQREGSNYAAAVNVAARIAISDYFVIANNDVQWLPGESLLPALHALTRSRTAGVAGPQLVFPDGSWQRSYGDIPSIGQGLRALACMPLIEHARERSRFLATTSRKRIGAAGVHPRVGTKRVGYIDAACMLVRRECFESVGGMDETYDFYGEDADFCNRARKAGWQVLFVPDARIMHVGGASSTAKQPLLGYLRKMLKSRQLIVERSSGPKAAWIYAQLERIYALESVLVYGTLGAVTRSARYRKHAAAARTRVRAVWSRA